LAIQVVYQFIFGKIYKEIRLKNYNDLSKQMMAYSSPLIANSISWWVNNASDRYILTWVSGVAVNGIYSISYKIPTILAVFQGIFYNAWSISAISEFDEVDNDGFIGNNYIAYSFISFSICSFLLLINIPIARIFYTGDFFIAWQCVPFLLVGTVFSGISQFEGALFAAKKKTKDVSFTTIIGATVNTICNLIFINLWGAIGAAISTMFGYFVIWVIRTLLIRGFVKMKVQWNIHIASLIFLIIQAFLATFNIFFIAQILLFLLIIFLHRRYFVHVLKNLRIVGK
jgi:O-antigen/teichoic acid export membrane protein